MRAQPWMNRTSNQTEADKFDLDLHRLAAKADRLSRTGTPNERKNWNAASLSIHRLRVAIRSMMHDDDRNESA